MRGLDVNRVLNDSVHVFHKKLKEFQMYDVCPNYDGSPPEPADTRLTKENVELKSQRKRSSYSTTFKMRNLEPPMKEDLNALR